MNIPLWLFALLGFFGFFGLGIAQAAIRGDDAPDVIKWSFLTAFLSEIIIVIVWFVAKGILAT